MYGMVPYQLTHQKAISMVVLIHDQLMHVRMTIGIFCERWNGIRIYLICRQWPIFKMFARTWWDKHIKSYIWLWYGSITHGVHEYSEWSFFLQYCTQNKKLAIDRGIFGVSWYTWSQMINLPNGPKSHTMWTLIEARFEKEKLIFYWSYILTTESFKIKGHSL